MTALEILKAARTLIENPLYWTLGTLARDSNYEPCVPLASQAKSWDSAGAVIKIGMPLGETPIARNHVNEVLRILDEECGMPPRARRAIAIFNDNRPHEEVLAVFDALIAKLELVVTMEKTGTEM
jgi:hypothetical protein